MKRRAAKRKTAPRFEQVSLELVRKIAAREAKNAATGTGATRAATAASRRAKADRAARGGDL
jgi:hypothetical protein